MADTLAEIYRDTLVESDFNSSGEATIVTTDSSTSHVIKAVQVVEGNSNISVAGSIDVNGFNVGALTGNSSGTEIVAPSSTVKVKTDAFPLSYIDASFVSQTAAGTYSTYTDAKINNFTAAEGIESNGLTYGNSNITSDDAGRTLGFNLGPNNTSFVYRTNYNSTTQLYVYNSSGNIIGQDTQSYTPKWWDGVQYIYWYASNSIKRMDVFTGTQITFFTFSGATNPGTYARMFGVKDKYLFFWPDYSTNYIHAYNFETNKVQIISQGDPQYAFSSPSMERDFHAVETSTGFKLVCVSAINDIRCYNWSDGTVLQGAQYVSVTGLSSDNETLDNAEYKCVALNGKLYYRRRAGKRICYIDLDSAAPAFGGVLSSADIAEYAGADLSYQETTPTSSTVSGRNYGTAPSLGLRITGVTST